MRPLHCKGAQPRADSVALTVCEPDPLEVGFIRKCVIELHLGIQALLRAMSPVLLQQGIWRCRKSSSMVCFIYICRFSCLRPEYLALSISILACAGKFLSAPSQICVFSKITSHALHSCSDLFKGVDVEYDSCILYRPLGSHQSSNFQSLLAWVGFKPDVKACVV